MNGEHPIAEEHERRLTDLEKRFVDAFPGGDHIGHCRYHALQIELLEERRRLRRAVTEKTVAGLVWLGIIGIGLAVWQYVKDLLKG